MELRFSRTCTCSLVAYDCKKIRKRPGFFRIRFIVKRGLVIFFFMFNSLLHQENRCLFDFFLNVHGKQLHEAMSGRSHFFWTYSRISWRLQIFGGGNRVEISDNLSFNNHIQKICTPASRSLGFIKRNIRTNSPAISEIAYKTLVRPISRIFIICLES